MANGRPEEVTLDTSKTLPNLAQVRFLVGAAQKLLKSDEPVELSSAIWRLLDAAGLLAQDLPPKLGAKSHGVGRPTDRGFQLLVTRAPGTEEEEPGEEEGAKTIEVGPPSPASPYDKPVGGPKK